MTQIAPAWARPNVGVSVEFRAVSKHFASDGSGAAVVDRLSLSVGPGEICVLVGPSGCGKTTSLRMVNRLVEPTSGSVLIDGEDVKHRDVVALRLGIGYVIQQIGLFPHKTVSENVATVPRLLGWTRERTQTRVEELLQLVGLRPEVVRNRYPSQLSGGERQRVGVARALAAEPPLMLMDEPFGAVDPIVRESLQDEFLRIHQRLRMTVLLVTHDIDEAIKMGSKVAVMREGGCLEQYSAPVDLLLHPSSDYVAQFVGRDRLLKRLGLLAVRDLALQALSPNEATTVQESLPRIRADATVRDVLPVLITSEDHAAVVVDGSGARIGVLTLPAVAAMLGAADVATTREG